MSTGLNGWLGRFIKRAIVKVASFVDSTLNTSTFGVSSEIGSFQSWAEEIGSGGSSFWSRISNNTSNIDNLDNLANDPRGNYEPTELEAIELEKFSDELALIISDVSNQQLVVISDYNSLQTIFYKYTQINALLERIAIIKEYYKYNETNNLSKPAIELRNLIVEVLLSKIVKEVEELGWQSFEYELVPYSVNVTSGKQMKEFMPFKKAFSFPSSITVNYYQFGKSKTYSLDPIEVTNPVDSTDVIDNTTTTQQPTKKKSSFGLFAGLTFAGFVLFAAANKKDKNNQKK